MVAGGDVILVPSRFEPCGLTQYMGCNMAHCRLFVRREGLADTVTNSTSESIKVRTATGFVFQKAEADDLRSAIQHAFASVAKNNVF